MHQINRKFAVPFRRGHDELSSVSNPQKLTAQFADTNPEAEAVVISSTSNYFENSRFAVPDIASDHSHGLASLTSFGT